MKHCTQCGHVLGLGRFCTNCGHPVASRHADPLTDPIDLDDGPTPTPPTTAEPEDGRAWRTDTAERVSGPPAQDDVRLTAPPAVPRLPPAVGDAPPPPRFPLFADEVAAPATPPPAPVHEPVPPAPAAWAAGDAEDGEEWEDWEESDEGEDWEDWDAGDRRRPRAVWVVGAVVLLAAFVLGAWFLGQALGGDDPVGDPASGGAVESDQAAVDRTADATATAPRTAPSTEDVDGNPTTYDAGNMLDGVPETAWRAAGDGSGIKLVFTFPEKTRISEVGLVNGYAKTATDPAGTTFDWYAGHRRITQVTWNFGVGDVVRQDLQDDPALQTVEVGPVEVRKIVLKIVATTAPGEGPARRNFTAISDVFLAG